MRILRLLACACLAGLLLACQPGAAGPAPIEEPTTIVFIAPEEYRRLYEPLVAKFKEKEPNITVQVKSEAFSQIDADVYMLRWFDTAGGLPEEREPLDLTPLLQQETTFNPDDYLPGALDTFKNGEVQYALPTGVDPFVIFFNQELFDRAGVPYPQPGWTLDNFRTAALQISQPEAGIYGYVPSDFYLDAMFFTFQFGVSPFGGQQAEISPESVQALEWYASLFGEAAPNEEQMQEAYAEGGRSVAIVTGKAGMWMGAVSSQAGDLGGLIRFKVGIAPIPQGPQSFSPAQYEGLMISAKTANPQAAWRWVSFLASQPVSWVYPARKSLAESAEFIALFGKDQAAGVASAVAASTSVAGVDFEANRNAIFAYFSAVRSVVNGGIPPAEALENAAP
jgi:ABC-type glycerol-3-phosphate transport system substrate-binding protein